MTSFLDLVQFILITTGATTILARGHIFNSIRPKGKFWHCCQCLGFYVGAVVFIVGFGGTIIQTIGAAFIGSFSAYALASLIDDDGLRINKEFRATKKKND